MKQLIVLTVVILVNLGANVALAGGDATASKATKMGDTRTPASAQSSCNSKLTK